MLYSGSIAETATHRLSRGPVIVEAERQYRRTGLLAAFVAAGPSIPEGSLPEIGVFVEAVAAKKADSAAVESQRVAPGGLMGQVEQVAGRARESILEK